jgi:hypothetical protein
MNAPQISPDGRHYWNGATWVPLPPVPAPQRSAFAAGFAGTTGGCAALIFVPLGLTLFFANPALLGTCLVIAFCVMLAFWIGSGIAKGLRG